MGIDIEFTRHFKRRLKSLCFSEDVAGRLTAGDLKDLFENAFQKHAQKISKFTKDEIDPEGVFKDIERSLNIPFKLIYNPNNQFPLEIINKTISSKSDFQSSNEFYFI